VLRCVLAAGILEVGMKCRGNMRRLIPVPVRSTLALIALIFAVWPQAADAQIRMPIVGAGGVTWPVAVSGLKNLGGDESQVISSNFDRVLSRDLTLSGYYTLVDPHSFIEDPQKSGYELGQFNFDDWKSIRAEFLVKGSVQISGRKVNLTARLFDVYQQRSIMGRTFSGDAKEVPRMARRFADAILKAVTGIQGPFDSKLAFVSTRGGRFKEIYTQSIDGEDLFQVTNNPTINLFPMWDHNADQLLYLSYKTMSPGLYIANLVEQRESRIDTHHGRIIGGAISPDGHQVVGAIENSGVTNLYLMDPKGYELRELTDTGGINVSPSFSPDGRTLAFTSDRSGTPQIYTMSVEGGAAKRITYSGNYNTTPAISPKGDSIAYQSREGGRFDIFQIPIGGGTPVMLTDGVGSNESASWSPDARYIAFASMRGGRWRIYILQVESHKIISALTEDKGNDTNPSWSWWLGD
jgi:TolB protein